MFYVSEFTSHIPYDQALTQHVTDIHNKIHKCATHVKQAYSTSVSISRTH